MKKILFLALMLIGLAVQADEKPKTMSVTYQCDIECHRCEEKIMKSIPFEKGVKDVHVDLDKHEVYIAYKSDKNDKESLKKSLEALGYTVTEKTEQAE